ncbi:transcriptional regulator [Brevibacterium luteolum]|uniref:transcriptional regulator n=1 Tax=Brevibacterium luteolum TaxID=199591 RepID=UPI001C24EB59|nr:transcriptional regulator [Brevibacterium luteolum]MBU8579130.1 transcriptional regulator [Brevibacterium luteolum]
MEKAIISARQQALAQLSPLLTNPSRLALAAGLHGCQHAHFQTIREQLGMSDSTLSKHISALESEGLVHVRKGFVGKRARTWVSLTDSGRTVYRAHMGGLRQLAALPFPEAEDPDS